MRTAKQWAGSALVALTLVAAGCADDRTNDPTAPSLARGSSKGRVVYDQVEFLGNPLVSEVTIVKANHDRYNRTQPYNTNEFLPQTANFVTSFGRPLSLAQTLGSVLYPDMLVVNTAAAKPGSVGWLSWALDAGYGGRLLTDDVVDLGLTAIFSSFLTPEGALCAPFELPLCTDNVNGNDRAFSPTFPYLATPHL